jgi:hypothetical protein
MRTPLSSKTFVVLIGMMAFATLPALATPIAGTDTVGSGVLSTNEIGGNLGTSTSALLNNTNETFSVLAIGNGSFNIIPVGSNVTLGGTTLNFGTASSFSFTSAAVGNFTAQTILAYDETPTSIDLFVTGLFTPGTDFPIGSTASSGASENLGFTQTGGETGQISLSGTFASPPAAAPVPAPVPEPITIAVFGAGLAGLALMRRRKAKAWMAS